MDCVVFAAGQLMLPGESGGTQPNNTVLFYREFASLSVQNIVPLFHLLVGLFTQQQIEEGCYMGL